MLCGSFLDDDAKSIKPEKLADTFLDNCFLLDELNGEPACSLRNPENGRELLFYAAEQYPHLQIYTPLQRNTIAIENMSSAPDSFNNKMGLIIFEPGQSQTFTVGYQVLLSQ